MNGNMLFKTSFQHNVCSFGYMLHVHIINSTMIIVDYVENLIQKLLLKSMQFVCVALENHHKFTKSTTSLSLDAF